MKKILLAALVIASVTVYGQADFSGKWKLNSEKSEFNSVAPSTAPVSLVVEQKKGTITYQRNDRPKESLKIDGTVFIEINGEDSKTKVSMQATADKKGLIETRTYTYGEDKEGIYETKKIRTWMLSNDKKTLTIKDHIEASDDNEYEMVLVYERE